MATVVTAFIRHGCAVHPYVLLVHVRSGAGNARLVPNHSHGAPRETPVTNTQKRQTLSLRLLSPSSIFAFLDDSRVADQGLQFVNFSAQP